MLAEQLREEELTFSAKCIREWILVDKSHVCDGKVQMMSVNSWLISGGRCCTLKNYNRPANKIRISRFEDCKMHEHRVYASREFGAERKMLNNFVLARGEGDGKKKSGGGGTVVVSLLSESKQRERGTGTTAVHRVRSAFGVDAGDKKLGCICLGWATTDGEESKSILGRALKENGCTVAREWFGAISFRSILSTVHVVGGNIAVLSLIAYLSWTLHPFYINTFLRESGMARYRVQG